MESTLLKLVQFLDIQTKHSDKLLNSPYGYYSRAQEGEIRIAKLKEIEGLFFGQIKKVIDLDNISGKFLKMSTLVGHIKLLNLIE